MLRCYDGSTVKVCRARHLPSKKAADDYGESCLYGKRCPQRQGEENMDGIPQLNLKKDRTSVLSMSRERSRTNNDKSSFNVIPFRCVA